MPDIVGIPVQVRDRTFTAGKAGYRFRIRDKARSGLPVPGRELAFAEPLPAFFKVFGARKSRILDQPGVRNGPGVLQKAGFELTQGKRGFLFETGDGQKVT